MAINAKKLIAKTIFKKVLMQKAASQNQNVSTQEYINNGNTNYHEFLTNLNSYSAQHPEEKKMMKDVVKTSQEQFPKAQRTDYSDAYARSLAMGHHFNPNERYNYGMAADSCAAAARFANNPQAELKHYFDSLKFIALFTIGVPFLIGMMAISRNRFFKNLLFSGLRRLDNNYKEMKKKGIERKYSQELFNAYRKGDKEKAAELEKKCFEKAGVSLNEKDVAPEEHKEVKEVNKKEIKLEELKDKNNIKLTEKVEEKTEEKTLVEDKEIVK